MKPPLHAGSPDDFQTPPEAIYPLLPFLPKEWTIWECAAGQGNLVRAFQEEGYKVIATDILTGQNFLTYEPPEYDVIITSLCPAKTICPFTPPHNIRNSKETGAIQAVWHSDHPF